ncbi:SDR family oxidoreductase [Steroidobacter flavus]|uniref:SDR family oxidoreductase n=1 Tax=Steroidobacter flavus TaxID=1842136 RepID=A0ABV8T3W9_9GAMM
MRIVVVGGSGLVGAKLVGTLRHRGHDVLAASRHSGVNTITGEGLEQAMAGCNVVIDVTNSPSFEDDDVMNFFETSCRNLLSAAQAARVKHHVVLSIVGTDRLLESGYFRAKMRQEELTRQSLIPHTILRSTQFFEFMPRVLQSEADERAVRVSPALVQPIASAEVAAALADLATASPRNGMLEFAGPECFRLHDAVERVMHVTRDSRALVADPQARYFGARLSEDTLTPDEGAIIGVGRFDDWLQQTGGAPAIH